MKSLFAAIFLAAFSNNETEVITKVTTPEVIETTSNVQPLAIVAPTPTPTKPLSPVQKEEKATQILDKVSANTKSKTTIKLDFELIISNGEAKDTQKGDLKIKGDKYKYNISGVTKISDGKKTAEVIDIDKEVTIGELNFNDPDEFSPQQMFKIYEKGYKYRHMGTKVVDGTTLDLIDLYPDTGNKLPYRSVTLYVNTTTNEIVKIEMFHKTSSKVFTIKVNKSVYNQPIDDSEFKCDCSKWPAKDGWDCDDTSGSN